MNRDIIYLAGLLHDIGKFYQRADPDGAAASRLLSQRIKDLEGSICPRHYKSQQYTHKHVLWTAQFFEDIQHHFRKYLALEDGWNVDKVMRLSATHHAPSADNILERIIQKADHYSSGIDRDKNEGTGWKDAAEESDTNWNAFKRTRMRSIFESISLSGEWPAASGHRKRLPLKAITTGSDYFPLDSDAPVDAVDYHNLWTSFMAELNFVQNKTLFSFNESLLFLLEKYTSRIPASTLHLPDVSLYDHLKTTAAFANCLYAYIEEGNRKGLPSKEEKPFALVGGALSGIQKFIYSIVAKGAAKNLKGRSFYLQILVDNLVLMLIDKLGLQSGNVIYSSGGGFYLIAPNLSSLSGKLKEIEDELTERLFEYHGTELYLALDFAPFGEGEIFNQTEEDTNIGQIWKELGEKLSLKKVQRFRSLIQSNFEKVFHPHKVNAKSKRDSITGEELGNNITYLDDNARSPVNDYTYKQIELGRHLKSVDYLIVAKEKLTYFPNEIFSIDPMGLGLYNYLISKDVLTRNEANLRASADNVRVIHFNKENFLEPLKNGINNVYGFAWYGGNDYPENEFHDPKTFEELTGVKLDRSNYNKDAKRIVGPELSRLGVLRMDVDNLGAIFRRGLSPDRRSFSRFSTLSRSLDWFFKGYLNTIWKTNKDYRDFTQIIYSGGDDLFIVGKWDLLIRMAADIHSSFKLWVCNNPEITLSGGMAVVGSRFPILKSAVYSESFEKAAKAHTYGGTEKNSFAFISYRPQHMIDEMMIPLNWNTEYPYLIKLKEEITDLMTKADGLSENFASVMYNLLQQANMNVNGDGRYNPKNHRVAWLAAYQFKRSSDGKNQQLTDFFRLWSNHVMTGKITNESSIEHTRYHALQLLAIAARWATLEKRSII